MGKFLLLLILLAVVIYLTVRVIERRGIAPRRSHRPPPGRPVGPDDDPDFLRGLDGRRPDGPDDSR